MSGQTMHSARGLRWGAAIIVAIVLLLLLRSPPPSPPQALVVAPVRRSAPAPRFSEATFPAAPAPEANPVVTTESLPSTLVCHIVGTQPVKLIAVPADGTVHDPVDTTSGGDVSMTLPPGAWRVFWQPYNLDTLYLDEREEVIFGRQGVPGSEVGVFLLPAGEVVDDCEIDPRPVHLSGVVRSREGEPLEDVDVLGCGIRAVSGPGGRFEAEVPRQSPCEITAVWRDGLLRRNGDPVALAPAEEELSATLVVDTRPVAGVGVAIAGGDDGIVVRGVVPGAPADRAELQAGDVILSVDGESTEGKDVAEFLALCTGLEGTPVTLQVREDEEVVTVTMVRERLVAGRGEGPMEGGRDDGTGDDGAGDDGAGDEGAGDDEGEPGEAELDSPAAEKPTYEEEVLGEQEVEEDTGTSQGDTGAGEPAGELE